MQPYGIGLRGEPGKVKALRAPGDRPYRILPVKSGDEVPAGIAHYGHLQPAHHLQHISAESLFIRHRMAGLIDAAVDGPAQMFDK